MTDERMNETATELAACMNCGSDDLGGEFGTERIICGVCETSHARGPDGRWYATTAATMEAYKRAQDMVPDEFSV